ncbi:hypothetical protein Y88_0150 [Novosphingobium nitrogenifigens DSM 19370]|uniref:PepSY-associated TM helix domain-containing protein n=1 Tax=Novosphingobium nitrogenifigens DSM 19370 TaxID=983920 RepID=F1ZB35_9SPHN|nr:PepSY-associated TM helix domain-containing protein [Novosphingobium nitrogenifigens]EGD58098.1 hypothetical protein Y88_0150 [Novosphingobium nitrogenifigens DSM 19370]
MVRPTVSRATWVLLHRWAGLTLALFLSIAGLTGMALAWEDTLESWTAPALLLAPEPTPGAPMLDPLDLRARALARHPGMTANFLPLTVEPGHALRLRMTWAPAPGTRQAHQAAPDWDELFIDPYTGRELGHRRWGDITQGSVNLLPFLYRLHYSLLLGTPGQLAMGIAALIWTLDCFIGFYLTLPVRPASARPGSASWWHRWKPSWKVRRRARGHKLTFDLHRAGGLWVWPVLLVLAWSSVSFNLPQVYAPVMALAGQKDERALLASLHRHAPAATPVMDFGTAARVGMRLALRGPTPPLADGTSWLWHVPTAGAYVYGFTTSGDIPDEGSGSRLAFDDRTGAALHFGTPDTTPAANRFTDWIVALHMARVFGWPWRVFMTVIGAAVTMLSVTGILLWARKRSARLRSANLHSPPQQRS